MSKSRWQRFKEWWTIDHVVDLCVDALLLIWEVVSSPILIVVRIIRHFIGDWFGAYLQNQDMSLITADQITRYCDVARERELVWMK